MAYPNDRHPPTEGTRGTGPILWKKHWGHGKHLHVALYLGSWSLVRQRNSDSYPRHATGDPRRVALAG